LLVDYEVTDAGNITLDVTVPLIGANFRSGRNFYSRKEAEIDYTNAAKRVREDAQKVAEHLAEISQHVDDPLLDSAREKLDGATSLRATESNPEATKQAMDDVQQAKLLLEKARKANLQTMRQVELDHVIADFDRLVRKDAKPSELSAFDAMTRTAEAAISRNNADFETYMRDLRSKVFGVLIRQDWFIIARFNWFAESPHLFADSALHARWVSEGKAAQQKGDIEALKRVVYEMEASCIAQPDAEDVLAVANIVRMI